ncbi:MAG: nicotinamide-nucleotide amidohydrolase family protein [Deltaproteobacteria bacterium]|nr:nicotinamide-nucleotide amidohydrolase family protein [Deltaproteobacteria bacterium]
MAPRIRPLSILAGEALKSKGLTLATAESCTGGLLSKLVTDAAGSSDYFRGGVIAYSNDIKEGLLKVRAATLNKYGAVSVETAGEMARGVKKGIKASIGVSITGIAGPGGGRPGKPVGTVYIGASKGRATIVKKFLFKGSRAIVRKRSAEEALKLIIRLAKGA